MICLLFLLESAAVYNNLETLIVAVELLHQCNEKQAEERHTKKSLLPAAVREKMLI